MNVSVHKCWVCGAKYGLYACAVCAHKACIDHRRKSLNSTMYFFCSANCASKERIRLFFWLLIFTGVGILYYLARYV